MKGKIFKLTVEDNILLHLLDYLKIQDDFELPIDITQPGIAAAVGIKRSHGSYAIKGLKKKGLVDEKLAHVRNQVRKRKTYLLTNDGLDYTRNLKTNIEEKKVEFIDNSGKSKRIRIKEILKYYSIKIPIVKIINLITSNNCLEERSLKQLEIIEFDSKIDEIKKDHINFIDNMAQPTNFFGRNNELAQIKKWIKLDHPKIILINGIPGIGKTTLAAETINLHFKENKYNLFWCKIHEWDSLRAILSNIGDFLSKLGKNKLNSYLQIQQIIELSDINNVLEKDFKSLNLLMVFDDFQKSNEKIKQLFSGLVELFENNIHFDITLLVLSRDLPKFYNRRKVAIKQIVSELELSGLDSNASRNLLSLPFLNEKEFSKIYSVTNGHPLSLELIRNHIMSKTMKKEKKEIESSMNIDEIFRERHDINLYFREEILQNLIISEKKLLEIVSVFHYPVPPELFFIEEGIDYNTIDKLDSRSIIQETSNGYDTHELIKEFFYRRLTPKLKKKYHLNAAKYYMSELMTYKSPQDKYISCIANPIIEAQYHYIRASEHQKAAELAEEHGEELIGMGFTEEFNRNIDDLNPNLISKRIWSELLIHKGHILTVNGEWDKAKTLYEDSLKLSEKIDHKCGMARAYNAIGIIHYRKGDWKSAMRNYELALDLANKEDDDKNSSKIYSNIGLINWGNGKFEKAIEFIKRSLELSKKLNEKQGIARAYNNLGIIYWEQHKYDEAIDSYNMSLEISKELGDKQTIAILYDNLGEVYRLKNDKQRAEKFYKKSLEISEVLGFKWQIAEVNCNLGLLYKSLDKNRSKKHLNTALELYTTLGAKRELEKVKELMKLK